ncbi:MAG: cell pole-organizing protein PopZ [Paracoccaceae bacterium]|jgi:cell pole-organizing protein PopZ
MSDQNSQPEPSMEEILASIRRIISEDGDEETAAAPEAAPEAVADAVEEPEAGAEPEAVAEPEPEAPEAAEPAEEEDVLELTDEVQDDGTVVNLNTGEAVDEDETPEEFVEALELDEEEDVELEMVDAEEEPAEEAAAEPEPAPEPEVPAQPAPAPEPADILAAEAADRLVSENPAMNSVTSLSALAAAVDTHRRAVDPSIGPRTIEDLVKDVMRPMIREWLDENLPSLVERMVGREIERMTREAEDISQR